MVAILGVRPCAVGRSGTAGKRFKDFDSFRPALVGARLLAFCAAVCLFLTGCVLAPRGVREERERAAEAGRPYEPEPSAREVPPLPPEPDWRAVLQRAFLNNGDLEAAYFEWQAALARVDQAAAYPNTNVSLGFEYMFSDENLKAWNRSSFAFGFDPMQNLSFPTKVIAAGRVAFDDARAAGERFSAAKFDLQKRALVAYWDFVLSGERLRVAETQVALLDLLAASAKARVGAGAGQRMLLDADTALRMAENDLQSRRAMLPQRRAELNAVMGRGADDSLPLPPALPVARGIPADDAALLAMGVGRNPELAALAHDVAGRRDALALARLQYIPDINPFAGFTGDLSQVAGATLSIPATIPRVRAGIEEARASLRGAEAMLRQAERDRAAEFVATLYALRESERLARFLEEQVLPLAERLTANLGDSYAAGMADTADLVESQRMLLDLRLAITEARVEREKRLAELEELAGVDVETLESRPTMVGAHGEATNG